MNKALLIVICDFLLLSLLSLATFEPPGQEDRPRGEMTEVTATNVVQSDLVDALQMALEQERTSREQLESELDDRTRLTREQEAALAARERRIAEYQASLTETERRAQQLNQERDLLEQQVTSSLTSLVEIEDQLNETRLESRLSQAQLEALQADLRRREQEAEELQNKLSSVEQLQQAAEREKQELSTRLQTTHAEKQIYQSQVAEMKEEVKTVRQEKETIQQQAGVLAEGVGRLADKSGELSQEIRENRELSGNQIFNDVVTNRVEVTFNASRSGLLGSSSDVKTPKTVLMSDGTNTFALFHVDSTPLSLGGGAAGLEYVYGTVVRYFSRVSFDSVGFLNRDPRVVMVSLTPEQVEDMDAKVYSLAKDPYKFADAVLVGASEGYYGEAPFQLDPESRNHVRMERQRFSRLTGEFNPSRGDLVFNRSGEVLGIMVNNEYCLVLDGLVPGATVPMGPQIRQPAAQQTLRRLGGLLNILPEKVR